MSISSVDLNELKKYNNAFNNNSTNLLVQNALCQNSLYLVSENRQYMQKRDTNFTNEVDPELDATNQGGSGRCWMFAPLNVMRSEIIRKLKLDRDFELSQSYLCFYEKLEKCNYFLEHFMKTDKIDLQDIDIKELLIMGCEDGAHWETFQNLVEKYGVIPRSCYKESINSFATSTMVEMLNSKLKEYAMKLVSEKNILRRIPMKQKMMKQIYELLCKMLGTPPHPDDKFCWSFEFHIDHVDLIKREKKRRKTEKYENFQTKGTMHITPLEFYEKFALTKSQDFVRLGNDPRNSYYKYYESYNNDFVIEGIKPGYFNVPINVISNACINSILDNTPVEFDCDVVKFLNSDEELLDDNAYNFDLTLGTKIHKLNKLDMMKCLQTAPTHAMIFVGVDLTNSGAPKKWKVENSWGSDGVKNIISDHQSTGHYHMAHTWFKKYVFGAVVKNSYIDTSLLERYKKAQENPITLPKLDIMRQPNKTIQNLRNLITKYSK